MIPHTLYYRAGASVERWLDDQVKGEMPFMLDDYFAFLEKRLLCT